MRGAGWGRWGANDERGALNLVDAQAVRRGLDAARRGQVVPLGLPVQSRQVPVMPPRPLIGTTFRDRFVVTAMAILQVDLG